MNALVSIIVPAYNIEKYIARCLDSILRQTYSNIEVIVVDDGSKDSTGSIVDEYAIKDARIVAIHQNNGGVSDARNRGLSCAKGTYIGFVDGDDQIEPEMYETLVQLMEEYGADISHCGYQMVFPDRVDYYHNTGIIKEQDRKKGLEDLLKGELVEPAIVNKLYKRDVLTEVRLKNGLRINEDLLFNYKAFNRSEKSVFVDSPFYHYMIRNGSATSGTRQLIVDSDCIEVANEIYLDAGPGIKELAYSRYIYFMMTVCRKNYSDCEYRRFQKEIKRELENEMGSELFKVTIPKKLKYMVIGSVYFPHISRIIYMIYDKKVGTSQKFRIR